MTFDWNEMHSYVKNLTRKISKIRKISKVAGPGLSVEQAILSKHAHKFDAPDSRYVVKYLPTTPYRKRIQEGTNQMKYSIVKKWVQ